MGEAVTRALVLDFGGVISKTLFETHPLSGAALGVAPGTLTWRGPFDPASDAPWRAMQAGEMTERLRVVDREMLGLDRPPTHPAIAWR